MLQITEMLQITRNIAKKNAANKKATMEVEYRRLFLQIE